MKPEIKSITLLSKTRAKAKMYEYGVPKEHHINLALDKPERLMSLAIAMLGDYTAIISRTSIEVRIEEIQADIKFSAQYFEAYYQSRLDEPIEPYLLLLGASSYYLCELPGSSRVLIKHLGRSCPNIDGEGLEQLIYWLLSHKYEEDLQLEDTIYSEFITQLKSSFVDYRERGENALILYQSFIKLKEVVYDSGTPRQLLLCDIIGAVIRIAYENSTWRCLPAYSKLPKEIWEGLIKKENFIKELWPSQHMLGRKGIFSGTSAVVQMPTSAGKTKATEIIIRSAFLSKRTNLAVIVAPFRALCHEIRASLSEAFSGESIEIEEFSDVIQDDLNLNSPSYRQQVYVVTPEKLVYVLRQAPEFAQDIGLLIYDEGHQFDSEGRGVTFELLLTTLKTIVNNAQTILISAVLSNTEAINDWLNKADSEIVSGASLSPNYRSIAFASWTTNAARGQLIFVDSKSKIEFYVPRVIEVHQLARKGRERIPRFFPNKAKTSENSDNTVALYLGLKLVPNGGVAIFCGTKTTAISITKILVDIYSRSLDIKSPANYANPVEVDKMLYLHTLHLGIDSEITQAASLGVYNHHNNIPSGLRMSIEHSIREGLTSFVICTSTLSQGVNLPIRYLVIANVQQGRKIIKVRDFHNLLGRAGRAGMYTEGSVIFANPDIYDRKAFNKDDYQWNRINNLLQPERAEPCDSALFNVFEDFKNESGDTTLVFEILEFAKLYIDGPARINTFVTANFTAHESKGFTLEALTNQINDKVKIFQTVESYLMSYGVDDKEIIVDDIVSNTLAYHLANQDGKKKLSALFKLLSDNVIRLVPDINKRRIFGKTLYGVNIGLVIEESIKLNYEAILFSDSQNSLLKILWPIVSFCSANKVFVNLSEPDFLPEFAIHWISGMSFYDLSNILLKSGIKYKRGNKLVPVTLEQIIDLCQNSFSFEGSLCLGAISSLFQFISPEDIMAYDRIQELQKSLQYGLPSKKTVALYELGFTDRVVAMDLSQHITVESEKYLIVDEIRRKEKQVRDTIAKYPAFFTHTLDIVLT